ncbi:hypothetical protein MTR67_017534 [Solanum verrucosum]|uniref:Uncharacterized protein n=1 Tax=Solanum verrucosum TaxID=315347 RepID=A0AAF0QI42_SOLVR|nr:hypothetical protein MTR67_017534 [Solanum verrucosum]
MGSITHVDGERKKLAKDVHRLAHLGVRLISISDGGVIVQNGEKSSLKCVGDPASIVPLETVAVKDSLSYEDVPFEILDRQVRRLRNKEVASVKVLWRSQSVEGATWEAEAAMKSKYPHIFPSDSIPA